MTRPTPPFVRNACVARGSLPANAFTPLYVVPTGFVFLFKALALSASGATTNDTYNLILVASDGTQVALHSNASWPTPPLVDLQTWHAMNEGDTVLMSSTHAATFWLSGAVLPFAVN